MQVSRYKDPYSKAYLNSTSANAELDIKTSTLKKNTITHFKDVQKDVENQANSLTNNTNALISTSERNYFKQLFPESAEQIDKHVVFNRNARVQSQGIGKGMIIDGKV